MAKKVSTTKKNTRAAQTPRELLAFLNKSYALLHKKYEDLFWKAHMGHHELHEKKDIALLKRDAFRTNEKLKAQVDLVIKAATGEEKKRLQRWQRFFSMYQIPTEARPLREQIAKLESEAEQSFAKRKQGYTDPTTKKFVESSRNEMRMALRTHSEEAMRKAQFDSLENLALGNVSYLVQLVALRNQFAKTLGYEDFYAYKLEIEEGMTKKELFGIFDKIYDKTKFAFADVRNKEKEMPGLRKPWNFGYFMTGDFTREEDPYFQFENSLEYWGTTFARMGVNFQGGTVVLDLLDRKGKYFNGFCHWPDLVSFDGKKRIPGRAQFTSNAVPNQIGTGAENIHTVFHEGGHAAHLLNFNLPDVCVGHEYTPMSTAWAEVQSMFMDSVSSSIEWRTRYAKNAEGQSYPFDIFERKLKATAILRPLRLMSIMAVAYLERDLYETNELTEAKAIAHAKAAFKKFFDRSEDSLWILDVPHLYSWESSCSYHAYGLAEIGVSQFREYFFKKYGYIVDNPKIGAEMAKGWQYGSDKTFPELVKLGTKKPLSPNAFLAEVTATIPQALARAKERIRKLPKLPTTTADRLNATIFLVHGDTKVTSNKKGFAKMATEYKAWLSKTFPVKAK